MKRNYLKPQIKSIRLMMNSFIISSNATPSIDGQGEIPDSDPENPATDPENGSRLFSGSIWDE